MVQKKDAHADTQDEAPATEDTKSPDEKAADAAAKHRLDEDVDAILDEIDEVLEENAEEFVRGFVQKGGQ